MEDLGIGRIAEGIKIDGRNVFSEAEDEVWSEIPLWIPTGCVGLDYAIGGFERGRKGGVPIGKALEISGMESTGKSALLDHIIREVLNAGGAFLLADAEDAHMKERLRLIGADLTNFMFIQKPRIETVDTGGKHKKNSSSEANLKLILEEFFEVTEKLLTEFRKHVGPEVPVVIGLDSLAAIETRAQSLVNEQNMKDKLSKADVMSQQFSGFCNHVTRKNAAIIIVNQLRSKPGVSFGDPMYSPGGDAKNFYFSIRIRMNSFQKITADKDWGKNDAREYLDEDITGIQCSGKVIKNKVAEPFRKFRFPLFFDSRGIWDELAFAQLLVDREKWRFSDDFEKDDKTFFWKGEKLGIGEKGLAKAFIESPHVRIEMEEELFM